MSLIRSRLKAINSTIVTISHRIASVALAVMLIHVAGSVLGRIALGKSVPATIELVSNWWMVIIFYFGLAATHRRNEQIRITALLDMTGVTGRRMADGFVAIFGMTAFLVLAWYAGQAAIHSVSISETTFGVFPIPLWPVKILMPFGFVLLSAQNAFDLAGTLNGTVEQDGQETGSSQQLMILAVLSLFFVLGMVLVLLSLLGSFESLTIGLLCLGAMLAVMFLGVPVGLAMVVCGAIGVAAIAGPNAAQSTLTRAPFEAAASWSLSVLPMFMLMGLVMWRAGITDKVFEVFQRILGGLPGGLALTTNFAGAALASASGSSAGISYALGRIAIPEMLKRGYQPSLATSVVVMAGVIGNLIPPSIVLIVYAGVAQTPVGPQLLAAVVPGVIISVAFGILIILRAHLDPRLAPPYDGPRYKLTEKLLMLRRIWAIPLIVFVVLGSMYGGWATATEAGALGCLAAIIVGIVENPKGSTFLRNLASAVEDAVASFAGIMLLFVGVDALTRMITLSGLAFEIADWVSDLGLGATQLILVLMLVYLILGTFMDTMAIILLTVPIFASTLAAANIDMIWFGVFITIMAELAVVTPPLGILVFIVHRLSQDSAVNMGVPVSLSAIFGGCGWFVGVALLCVLLFTFFPDIVMFLPDRS